MMKRILIVIILLLLVFMISCGKIEKTSTAMADQKKTGTKKNNFEMGKKLTTLKEVVHATAMGIDGNELFVLDEEVVYVYSTADFELLRQFGREGYGPGEFVHYPITPVMMQLFDDKVLLGRMNKLAIYSKSGKLIKEKIFRFLFGQFFSISENFVATIVRFGKPHGEKSKVLVKLFDPSFKEIKTIYIKEYEPEDYEFLAKVGYQIFRPTRVFVEVSGDKLFLFDPDLGFPIKVFNKDGEHLKDIFIYCEKVKMTESFKKEIIDWVNIKPWLKSELDEWNTKIAFPEYFPMLRSFTVEGNKLYGCTYYKQDNLSEFILIDISKNQLVKKFHLPPAEIAPVQLSFNRIYTIKDNKYYYLVDNYEEETWEFHMAEMKQ
jgi:hypothetical protein